MVNDLSESGGPLRPDLDLPGGQVAVTRAEIADYVGAAFAAGPATRDGLVAAAVSSYARPAVIETLHRLPAAATFPTIRDLWRHLSDVPIDDDAHRPATGGDTDQ